MLRDYNLALKQGVPHTLDVAGDFYRVLSAESFVGISFDDSVVVNRQQGMGGDANYKRVVITSPKDQDVVLAFGFGLLLDDRGNNVSKYPSCSQPVEDVPILAGTGQVILVESLYRYSATLSLPIGSGSIRIACNHFNNDNGGADNGIWLHGGQSVTLETRTGIWGTNRNGSAVNVGILVLGCSPALNND